MFFNMADFSTSIVSVSQPFNPLKSTDGDGNRFRAILFPQPVVSDTPWIEITVSGQIITYAIPDGLTELRGGEEQVVNLALTNSRTN